MRVFTSTANKTLPDLDVEYAAYFFDLCKGMHVAWGELKHSNPKAASKVEAYISDHQVCGLNVTHAAALITAFRVQRHLLNGGTDFRHDQRQLIYDTSPSFASELGMTVAEGRQFDKIHSRGFNTKTIGRIISYCLVGYLQLCDGTTKEPITVRAKDWKPLIDFITPYLGPAYGGGLEARPFVKAIGKRMRVLKPKDGNWEPVVKESSKVFARVLSCVRRTRKSSHYKVADIGN